MLHARALPTAIAEAGAATEWRIGVVEMDATMVPTKLILTKLTPF